MMDAVGRFRVVLALSASASAACVKIQSTTTYSQTLVTQRTAIATLPDSLHYTAAPRVDGQTLVLGLRSEETCKTSVVPVYRKEAHIAKDASSDPRGRAFGPATTLVLGVTFAGVGVYGYASADSLGMVGGGQGERTPDDYRNGGLVSAALGLGLLGIALVDTIRLQDEDRVVGEVEGEPDVTEAACHLRAAANVDVVANVAKVNWRSETATDADGKVRIDMHSIPEDAFASHELRLDLNVEGSKVAVVLAAELTQDLLAKLTSDPSSRVAHDRDVRATATCSEQVAAASAVDIDADTPVPLIERTEASWSLARMKCGDKWQPEHEQKSAEFRARVAATAVQRSVKQCASAGESAIQLLAQLDESGDRPDIAKLRDLVSERCRGAENADKVIAAFSQKEQELAKARARAEKADKLIDRLNDLLRSHDAVAIRVLVSKDNDAAALLRTSSAGHDLILQLASHWIGQLEHGASDAAIERQVCASRSLVLSFAGQSAWARLRADVAKRNDVARGARIAKEMDGGSCK